jgi:alpha-galactosidase
VRPVVQHGVHHRLGDPARDVSGVRYVSRDGAESVVLAYRTARRFGAAAPALPLRGLEAHARYRDPDTGREHHGAVLQSRGLPLDLPAGDPASTMVSLRRVGTSTQAQLTPNGVNEKP